MRADHRGEAALRPLPPKPGPEDALSEGKPTRGQSPDDNPPLRRRLSELEATLSEQRRYAVALAASEARYRALVEQVPAIVYITALDEPMRTLYISPMIERALGFSTEQWVTDTDLWRRQMHPDDLPRIRDSIQPTIRGECDHWVDEYRYITQAGEVRWFRDECIVLRGEGGARVMHGVMLDITAHRDAERALAASQARFRTLIEQLPAIVYAATPDEEETSLYLSPQICGLLGYTPEEWAADPDIWLRQLHPDDRERVNAAWLRRRTDPGWHLREDYRIYTRSGEERWLHEDATFVRDSGGDPLFLQGVMYDITEQKRAEEALRRSEFRYRSLVEQLPAIVYTAPWGNPDDATYVSPQLESIMGYTREEWLSGPNLWYSLLHPQDRDRAIAAWERFKAGDGPFSEDYRLYDRDGRMLWFHEETKVVHDESGRPPMVQGMMLDITERKRAEDALRESEQRLATIFREMPAVIAITDLEDGRLIDINEACERVLGYARDEIIGRRSEELSIFVSPGTREQYVSEMRRLGRLSGREMVVRDKRGLEVHGLVSAVPVEVGGRRCLLNVFSDISVLKRAEHALRESEERFRALYEQAPIAYQSLDAEGRFLDVNPSWQQILGYSREEVIGRSFAEFLAPKYVERFRHSFPLFKAAGETHNVEFEMLRKDGARVLVSFDGRIGRFADGSFQRTHCALQDVTERRRLEEQFRQAQKMETIGRLAGGVAHDFNNLLTAIIGHASFAMDSLSPLDRTRDDIEQVLQSAERASSLTRQLLAFSRRQVIEPRVINLNGLILNMDRMVRRLIGEDMELVTLPASDLGLVRADPGQIEQALVNLIVNARDAMPGGGRLTIETSNVTLDEQYVQSHPGATVGDHVMLAVSDTGTGMSDEVKAHLFEPFFTTKEVGKGTGLGLATVYGIVKQHQGNIWAYSELGVGTSFKIYLPRVSAQAERLPRRDEAGFLPQGHETVLLVEDEPSVRAVATRILREQGYNVIESANGEEALRLARAYPGPIHLLVSDVVMPQMGGKDLAERLLLKRPDMAVLFVSGYTDDAIVHRGIVSRSAAFLQKPFTASSLARKVRQVLDVADAE